MLTNIFIIISFKSFKKLTPSFSLIYPVATNNFIQYFVSFASFNAMESLEIKSFLLCPSIASLTLAPMLVPLLIICFEIMNSLLFVSQISKQIHDSYCKIETFIVDYIIFLHSFPLILIFLIFHIFNCKFSIIGSLRQFLFIFNCQLSCIVNSGFFLYFQLPIINSKFFVFSILNFQLSIINSLRYFPYSVFSNGFASSNSCASSIYPSL